MPRFIGDPGTVTPPPPAAPTVTVDSTDTLVTGAIAGPQGATNKDWHGRASVVRLASGDVMLAWRDGTAHNVNDGALHCKYSDDDGVTWSATDTHIDTTAVGNWPMNPSSLLSGEDAGEPLLIMLNNGDVCVLMWRSDYGVTANGTYMARSTDDGQTWTTGDGPLSFPGFAGTADTDLRTFATDQGFIEPVSGDFYMGARIYPSHTTQTPSHITFVKTTDNGATWARVCADIMAITEDGGNGAQEVGLTYLGSNRIIAILRDNPQRKTFRRFSDDLGVTWGTLSDITSNVGIVVRPRVYTGKQLRGEASWWTDTNLLMVGAETVTPGNSQARRNCVWISQDSGITWTKFPVDTNTYGGDGGYGDVFYDLANDQYKFVSYRGSLTAADLVMYSLTITGI